MTWMDCATTPERHQLAARLSPSFARALPFAYERCGDDWSLAFNEYLHRRASYELGDHHDTPSPKPAAATPRSKRKGGDSCGEVKRACHRPLQDMNLRPFGNLEQQQCAHSTGFVALRSAGHDDSAMQL